MEKRDSCTVFGFPGNPISTFVNCLAYFYPWYYKSLVGLEVGRRNGYFRRRCLL